MKKKFLTLIVTAAVSVCVLAGCGSSAERVDGDNVAIVEADDAADMENVGEVSNETEDTSLETEPEKTETLEEVKESEPEPTDWLEANGIIISSQGDFQCNLYGFDYDTSEATGDFWADVNVVISETTDGVDDGFKKVSAVFTQDMSNNTGNGYDKWISAFDRYTGTSFEFDSSMGTLFTQKGQQTADEGFATIQNGDEYYDVSLAFKVDNQYPIIYDTLTVTCPVDYDGTVFQIGYSSPELAEKDSQIDYSARLYTIDELPHYGDGYLYFTMSND